MSTDGCNFIERMIWSEVARRIAHEIKNPLTPIQLSAERIARNFGIRANSEPGAIATGLNG